MTAHSLPRFLGEWLPQLEAELQRALDNDEAALASHYGMLRYHMGWVNARFEPDPVPGGKRLRPVLTLLACAETGGRPEQALPAAAAIELLHNFSLIHDDIEDGDAVRRHRATVWTLWGMPQAVNAGDSLFALAFAAMQRLGECGVDAGATLAALNLFTRTCVALTEGQHLDMRFEDRSDVKVEEYMRMIEGKTAALIGASAATGALVAGAPTDTAEALWRFGRDLGLAFQIQDDILGIWGDPALTGKAAGNDILRRKKSLPMLYTLNHAGAGARFAALLAGPHFGGGQLDDALALLEEAEARTYAAAQVRLLHERSMAALYAALGAGAADSTLLALTESLLHRDK